MLQSWLSNPYIIRIMYLLPQIIKLCHGIVASSPSSHYLKCTKASYGFDINYFHEVTSKLMLAQTYNTASH